MWPSAYASGALVKCRKKGAANWGNSTKKESFEVQDGVVEGAMPEPIDPKKHKEAQKKQKIRKLAIGNENPNEKKVAEKKAGGPKMMGEGKYSKSETYVKGTAPVRATYGGKTESFPKETYKKKTKTEELNIDLAVDYFFTEGINEDGVDIFIEELGLDQFVSFVEGLSADTYLTEARAAKKARKGAKSYDQVKAEIDAREAAKKKPSAEKTKQQQKLLRNNNLKRNLH